MKKRETPEQRWGSNKVKCEEMPGRESRQSETNRIKDGISPFIIKTIIIIRISK